jgi:ferredoxin
METIDDVINWLEKEDTAIVSVNKKAASSIYKVAASILKSYKKENCSSCRGSSCGDCSSSCEQMAITNGISCMG